MLQEKDKRFYMLAWMDTLVLFSKYEPNKKIRSYDELQKQRGKKNKASEHAEICPSWR